MALRYICFVIMALGAVSGAPKKNTANLEKVSRVGGDRIAALYVKDSENGDLRFLTGSSNLNQFITQQQNLLEQLRPNNGNTNLGLGTNTGNLGLGTTNTGTLGSLGTLGTLGNVGLTGTNGVTPIIVNLGNGGTTGTNSGLQGIAAGTSPIGDFLPQVIAQAVLNQRRTQNRNGNRRRPGNNRRRPGQGQVFVVRPSG